MVERIKTTEPAKVTIAEIDMSKTWDAQSQAEELLKQCKKLGLYKRNRLYCGFNRRDATSVRKAVGEKFCCSTEKELFGEDDGINAIHYGDGLVAVYDGDKLEYQLDTEGSFPRQYKIVNENALVAVLDLKY